MSSVFEDVKQIMQNELGIDEEEIHEDTHLKEDLELDSTDTVALALALQQKFGVNLKLEGRRDMTVTQLCELTESALSSHQVGEIRNT